MAYTAVTAVQMSCDGLRGAGVRVEGAGSARLAAASLATSLRATPTAQNSHNRTGNRRAYTRPTVSRTAARASLQQDTAGERRSRKRHVEEGSASEAA